MPVFSASASRRSAGFDPRVRSPICRAKMTQTVWPKPKAQLYWNLWSGMKWSKHVSSLLVDKAVYMLVRFMWTSIISMILTNVNLDPSSYPKIQVCKLERNIVGPCAFHTTWHGHHELQSAKNGDFVVTVMETLEIPKWTAIVRYRINFVPIPNPLAWSSTEAAGTNWCQATPGSRDFDEGKIQTWSGWNGGDMELHGTTWDYRIRWGECRDIISLFWIYTACHLNDETTRLIVVDAIHIYSCYYAIGWVSTNLFPNAKLLDLGLRSEVSSHSRCSQCYVCSFNSYRCCLTKQIYIFFSCQ